MTIAQIRDTIRALNWTRNDLSGGTPDEFIHADVPARLLPKIAACRALVTAPRFARDIEERAWAIERAEATVARWQERRAQFLARQPAVA